MKKEKTHLDSRIINARINWLLDIFSLKKYAHDNIRYMHKEVGQESLLNVNLEELLHVG